MIKNTDSARHGPCSLTEEYFALGNGLSRGPTKDEPEEVANSITYFIGALFLVIIAAIILKQKKRAQ